MKKISIIVPIYNTEKYLEKCLESIISQDYKNLEIILINDGSTDNSLSICKKYERKDKRIKLINNDHLGVAESRNIGLKYATGDYIGFVDSDDFIDKDMYKTLIDFSEKYNADISMCRFCYFNDDSEIITEKSNSQFCKLNSEQALNFLLVDKVITNHLTLKLFKKELFKNILFPKEKKFEDISTMYKLINKSNKIIYITRQLYYYRVRYDSICKNITLESICDFLDVHYKRFCKLRNNKRFENFKVYNLYAMIKAIIKSGKWAIELEEYSFFYNNILDKYWNEVINDVKIINELELLALMDDIIKICYLLLKNDLMFFEDFAKKIDIL